MTAIQAMQIELRRIQQAQNECITEEGFVRTECRYKYQMLTNKARSLSESIEWLTSMYKKGV